MHYREIKIFIFMTMFCYSAQSKYQFDLKPPCAKIYSLNVRFLWDIKCILYSLQQNTPGQGQCGREKIQVQYADLCRFFCISPKSGEMQESSNQQAPHSVGDFLAPQAPTPQGSISTDVIPQPEPIKERIRWPKMSDIKEASTADRKHSHRDHVQPSKGTLWYNREEG